MIIKLNREMRRHPYYETKLSPEDQRKIDIATFEAERFSPDGVVDFVEYPEFYSWRLSHGMEPELPEPEGTRCPRCHSNRVKIDYPYIRCLECQYNEPLIDFPISQFTHLALEQIYNQRLV